MSGGLSDNCFNLKCHSCQVGYSDLITQIRFLPKDIHVSDVVSRPRCVVIIGRLFVVSMKIVVTLVDTRESSDPDTVHLDDSRIAEIENVGRHPATIGQLLEVVAGLVVAADEDCEDRGDGLPAVILVERAHGLVLVRHSHAGQVREVPCGLKISTTEKEVDLLSISFFDLFNCLICFF